MAIKVRWLGSKEQFVLFLPEAGYEARKAMEVNLGASQIL